MLLHQVVCLLDLGLVGTQDHKIVGITHKAIAGVVEFPVEAVERDVGEQGGNDAPLRRADRSRSEFAFLHHAGLEKSFDQTENVAVGDLGGDAGHDDLVRNVVEEPLMSASRTWACPCRWSSNT